MKTTQRTLVVLMPMVWSVRNVIYSGALRLLAEDGWRVHLLMPTHDPALFQLPQYADFGLAASIQPLLPPAQQKTSRLFMPLTQIVRSAFHQRNQIRSFPIYRKWLGRNYTRRMRLRENVIDLGGRLASPRFIFDRLVRYSEVLYRRANDLAPICTQLKALKPDLIWSTVCVRKQEYPYVLAAHDLQIPIVTSILSFDNLTSRTAIPVYDHYLVWNQRMKDQLIRYYPAISSRQVTITGTPQFDFHHNPAFRWSRETTLQRLKLPPEAQYILYTGSAQILAPDEPKLVTELARLLATDSVLGDYWLVVRLHPLDDWKRWQPVCEASEKVVLSYPWEIPPDQDGWTLSSPNDQGFWVSSLLHATCCINIASTTSLDAAIMDKPVIGIRFDREPGAPSDILYEEYETEHYIHLVNSGGLQLARSWKMLIDLIHDAVRQPERWQAERASMVAHEVGQVDGNSTGRVIQVLRQMIN